MKNFILLSLLCIAVTSFAGRTDSTFQRHQISFSVTNAMSVVLANPNNFGGYGDRTTPYYPFLGPEPIASLMPTTDHQTSYLPDYSLHVQIKYSLGISNMIRLETGIGYQLQGLLIRYFSNDDGYILSSKTNCYIGSLTIPVYLKFAKPLRKGIFTCTFGPNATLPFNEFYTTMEVMEGGAEKPSQSGHQRFNSNTISSYSSLGFDLKMGYEMSLNKLTSINIGPVINLTNISGFFNYRQFLQDGQMSDALQSYIGLDVAVNFAVGKKK